MEKGRSQKVQILFTDYHCVAVSGKVPEFEDEGHRRSPRRKLGRHPRSWTRPKIPLENTRMGSPTGIKGHISDEGTVPLWNSKRSHQCITEIRRNEVKPRPLNEAQGRPIRVNEEPDEGKESANQRSSPKNCASSRRRSKSFLKAAERSEPTPPWVSP